MNKLIKLRDKFILVSDERIKEGDYAYDTERCIISRIIGKGSIRNYKKIIAGIPKLPSIDFSLLSEKDCKTIGWVDAEKFYIKPDLDEDSKSVTAFIDGYYYGFEDGFNKAQFLNDKMFSLEDMNLAFEAGYNYGYDSANMDEGYSLNYKNKEEFIQSLQQTSWNVKVNKNNKITKISRIL